MTCKGHILKLKYDSVQPESSVLVRQRTLQQNICVTPHTLLNVVREFADDSVVLTFNRWNAPGYQETRVPNYYWREIQDVLLSDMEDGFPVYLVPRREFFVYREVFNDYHQSSVDGLEVPTYNEFLNLGSMHLPAGVGKSIRANTPANMLAFRMPIAEHVGVSHLYKSIRKELMGVCRRIAGFGQKPSFDYVLHEFRFEPGLEDYVKMDTDFVEFLR